MAQAMGGNKKRPNNSPAQCRYNNERRWEKNKARRIAKQAKKEAKQRERKLKREELKKKMIRGEEEQNG